MYVYSKSVLKVIQLFMFALLSDLLVMWQPEFLDCGQSLAVEHSAILLLWNAIVVTFGQANNPDGNSYMYFIIFMYALQLIIYNTCYFTLLPKYLPIFHILLANFEEDQYFLVCSMSKDKGSCAAGDFMSVFQFYFSNSIPKQSVSALCFSFCRWSVWCFVILLEHADTAETSLPLHRSSFHCERPVSANYIIQQSFHFFGCHGQLAK